jgi:hypothetical protein
VTADVFRPQTLGRAARTAFVLGLLVVIALVAAVGAAHQFNALVGDNTKDEMSRYLDDNAHSVVHPSGGGFRIDFPIPVEARDSEVVTSGVSSLVAPRDTVLVDDEANFAVVWFTLPGSTSATAPQLINALVNQQIQQFRGTKIAVEPQAKIDRAIYRDVVFRNVDPDGAKRYYDERIVLQGRKVWVIRVASHLRRDEAFRKFAGSFAFTS